MEELDAPTIAMFKRFQAALLTMTREWRDPDLEHHLQNADADERMSAGAASNTHQGGCATEAAMTSVASTADKQDNAA
jgi:hypothetical protein